MQKRYWLLLSAAWLGGAVVLWDIGELLGAVLFVGYGLVLLGGGAFMVGARQNDDSVRTPDA